jgi:hypothetical protein
LNRLGPDVNAGMRRRTNGQVPSLRQPGLWLSLHVMCQSCRVVQYEDANVWQGPRRPKLRDDRVNDRYIHMWLAIYISDDLSTQRATHGGILLHLATTRRLCCHAGEIHRTRCVPPNWMEPSCPQGPHEQQQPSSPTSRSFSIL